MNISPLLVLEIFTGVFFLIFLLLLWKKWTDIKVFFHPENFAKITMIESDNNMLTWIEKKNADLNFIFNNGKYNMFDKDTTGAKQNTVIYRSGRLAHFIYIEGNENPVDLRGRIAPANARLNYDQETAGMTDLFLDNSNPAELWTKIGIAVLVVGVIIIIVLLLKGQTPPPEVVA